jgi:hypothetical protein
MFHHNKHCKSATFTPTITKVSALQPTGFAEREPGKTRGAIVFSLNFLFLFFSRKKEKTKKERGLFNLKRAIKYFITNQQHSPPQQSLK